MAKKTRDTGPRPTVLYVDDQLGNLTAFRANLRRTAQITTTESGEEALRLLEASEFDVIVSDQRMDGMNGDELLHQTRLLRPHITRILLTAYADFNAVMAAINDGGIHHLVLKPWDRDEMTALIAAAAAETAARRDQHSMAAHLLDADREAFAGQAASGVVESLHDMATQGSTDRDAWRRAALRRTEAIAPILEYGRLATAPRPTLVPTTLAPLVHGAVALVLRSRGDRPLDVTLELAPDIEVMGDPSELTHLLTVMLGIAARAGNEVRIGLTEGPEGATLELSPAPSVGKPPPLPTARELLVARQLTARHEGSFHWDATEDGGSAFRVLLATCTATAG